MESRHRSVILGIAAVGAVLAVAFVTTREKPKTVQTAPTPPVSSAKAKLEQPDIAKQAETRLVVQAATSPVYSPPFEFKGLRLGMSGDAVLKARDAIDAADDDSHWSLSVYQNEAGRLYGVQQNLGGVNIESYVLAFTRKYGQPRVEQRGYRNGSGNEFHANVWTWERIHESISIHEICVGNVLEPQTGSSGEVYGVPYTVPIGPCLVLYSGIYAPKQTLPEI